MRRPLVRGLAFAVAGLLGVAIPIALASSGTWSTPPAQLSTNGSADTAMVPAVALSNGGDLAAVWLNQVVSDTSTTTELDAAVDSGSGFQPAQNVGPSDPLHTTDETYLNLPQVAEDGSGDAVAVWVDNGQLMWAEQSQPATTFTAAPSAIDSAESSSDAVVDADEHVAMDAGGDAIAVWAQEDLDTGDWSVMYSILPAGSGQSFGTVVTLASDVGNDPDPQVAVNQQSGDVTVAYLSGAGLHAFEDYLPGIASDPSSYGGLPTSGTQIYADSDSATLAQLSIAVGADGQTAFAWVDNGEVWSATLNYQESSFTGNGSEFAPDYILSGTSESNPEVAIYPSDAYDDETAVAFYDGDTGGVVVAARSSQAFEENGNVWRSGIQTYSEPATQQQPQLSIASDGVVTMVWEGEGSDEGVNTLEALSSDDNGSFASSTPTVLVDNINPAECDGTSCVISAANTPGDLVASWNQYDADSNPQIEAQCLQANSATGYTGTDTTVSPEPSTLTPSSCAAASTSTGTTSTGTTAPTGSTTTGSSTTGSTATGSAPAESTTTGSTATASTPTGTPPTPTPTPKVAQTIVATTVTGSVMVLLPGSDNPVPLDSLQSIPNGAVVEPGSGTVTLTFALPDGQTETGTFWGGDFRVLQAPGGSVNLTLIGGSFKGCPAPPKLHANKTPKLAAGVAKAKKPTKKPGSTVRSLWSDAKGNFTTKGQNGAAAVLGTTWLTRDQCDGTYFYVKSTSDDPQGAIEVTVLHPHRHRVKLKRGHSLLAPAPGYS